jgi:uncharacterized protein (DUF2267 family)
MMTRRRLALVVIAPIAAVCALGALIRWWSARQNARPKSGSARARLRYLARRIPGVAYRLRRRHPDPTASGPLLADRVRSTLGPLEKRLDVPRAHVLAEDQIVLLHGEVATADDAAVIEQAVRRVSGVRGVESYLHIGLTPCDTRPSHGRARWSPSPAKSRLIAAAREAGAPDELVSAHMVRAVLAFLAARIPDGERRDLFAHLPADVRVMNEPPAPWGRPPNKVRTPGELVASLADAERPMTPERAELVIEAVLRTLRELVPEEATDVAAALPHELREVWLSAGPHS